MTGDLMRIGNKNRNKKPVTREEAGRRAVKQMIAVILAGVFLLAVDAVMSSGDKEVDIAKEDGRLYMIRPAENEENGHLSLRAKVSGNGVSVDKKIGVVLDPYDEKNGRDEQEEQEEEKPMEESERLEYEVRSIVSGFNDDVSKQKVELPQTLDSGETISWEIENERSSNALMIFILTAFTAFCMYRSRFAVIEKRKKEQYSSVIRQLPEFVNRLVLLLNAGLVLTTAFERSIESSFDFKDDDYFYGKLQEIYVASRTTNSSVNREFRRFAKESGIRELMRVSNILNDNINKGVALTEKLQSESEMLWLNRKKQCEEKGRLAETKLTLPLMIFLMVLIMITVAPALLEL